MRHSHCLTIAIVMNRYLDAIAPTETLQSLCVMSIARVQPADLTQLGECFPYKEEVMSSSLLVGISGGVQFNIRTEDATVP